MLSAGPIVRKKSILSSQRAVGSCGLHDQATLQTDRGTTARVGHHDRRPLDGSTANDDEALKRELAFDIGQLLLDLTGIVDPTPISDGSNALLSLARGRFWDAAISAVSIVPYIGDLAKLGKLPRYLMSIRKAIALARRDAQWALRLRPLLAKVKKLLDDFIAAGADQLPDKASTTLKSIRNEIDRFLNGSFGKGSGTSAATGAGKGSPPGAPPPRSRPPKKQQPEAKKAADDSPSPKKPQPSAKKPVRRHDPCKTKGSDVTKPKNSVVDPDIDVDADLAKIRAGDFKQSGNDMIVNGRTYGIHSDTGRTYPISGPGVTNLDRAEHQFLKQLNSQNFDNAMKFADNFPGLDADNIKRVLHIWRKCK